MTRHVALVALAAVIASTASTASTAAPRGQEQKPAQEQKTAPEQRPPVFRTEANFVRVDVYPTKNDQPVQGLTAEDFEVLEDGVPQTISTFEYVRINSGTPPNARIEPNSVREGERMAANPRNRVFVVFLDVPHVAATSSHAIKEPMIRLFARMMGPDDLVAVMTPSMAPTQISFGRRTEVIERALREHWPWGMRESVQTLDEREQQYEICYPHLGPGIRSPLAQEMIDRRRERMVLEAMNDLVGYLGGVREERKAIILVTEGWRLYRPNEAVMKLRQNEEVPGKDPIGVGPDGRLRRNPPTTRSEAFGSKYECDADRMALAAMDNERYFRDLLDAANRTNSSFYPIDPRGLPVFDDHIGPAQPLTPAASMNRLRDRLETLKTLAENTDGLAILNNNDLDRGLRRVSDDLTSYYLLGYYSKNTKLDGRFRELKVRVKQPGVSVRSRRGYRAASAADITAARNAPAAEVSPEAAAATSAVSDLARIRADIPFTVRAVPASAAGASEIGAVWIAGELQASKEWAGGGSATIEITGGGVTTTATAELKAGERTFLLRVPLDKPASKADIRARFVPVSQGPGPDIPVTSTANVAVPAGLPSPLLFHRGMVTGNRLLPAGVAQFGRSERLRLELPLGDGDKPGPARLLDRAAKPLQVPIEVSERTDAATSQRWLVGDLTLAALGAGDYVVELSAVTAAGEKKVLTGIRVTR
jgi:VWFA-related protein